MIRNSFSEDPAVLSNKNLFNIQKKLSINVPLVLVKQAGNLILG